MPIRGRVIVIGNRAEGISKTKGTAWKKQEYVIETEGQYPKKVAFGILNDKVDQFNLQIGQVVEVEVDAQSREYNGRWYTELTAWRINVVSGMMPQQPAQMPPQQTSSTGYSSGPQFAPAPNTEMTF